MAAQKLRFGESLLQAGVARFPGLVSDYVVAVAEDPGRDSVRAFAVSPEGDEITLDSLKVLEAAAAQNRFGKLSPELSQQIATLPESDLVEVSIAIDGDFVEPTLPFDGRDTRVSAEEFNEWVLERRREQRTRVASASEPLVLLLTDMGARNVVSLRALPLIHASIPVAALRSAELNESASVVEIYPASQGSTPLGFAGMASMNEQVMTGGVSCGTDCDGDGLDVGIWEADTEFVNGADRFPAVNSVNTRFSTASNFVYQTAPSTCSAHADCGIQTGYGQDKQCISGVCKSEHLTMVAAALGMTGTYYYGHPNVYPADSTPNAPSSDSFSTVGAYNADFSITGMQDENGLEWLIDDRPVVFANRSMTGVVGALASMAAWAATHENLFMTIAGGNDEDAIAQGAYFHNGLVVGWYSYNTYDDKTTHRRFTQGAGNPGSSYKNPTVNNTLIELPHLLGPGAHSNVDGLHLTRFDVSSGYQLRTKLINTGNAYEIAGSSFAAPSTLAMAIQAFQYEGYFSQLGSPWVLKAVMLAGSVDSNDDGSVGKGSTWSQALGVDAEDGAGHVDMTRVKAILDGNRYESLTLADTDFVSCGTNCREYEIASTAVSAGKRVKAALVWTECATTRTSSPLLTNDLDLVVVKPNYCGVGATKSSTSVPSELEMVNDSCVENAPIGPTYTYRFKVRIKNGGTLSSCGSVSTQKAGLAWAVY